MLADHLLLFYVVVKAYGSEAGVAGLKWLPKGGNIIFELHKFC